MQIKKNTLSLINFFLLLSISTVCKAFDYLDTTFGSAASGIVQASVGSGDQLNGVTLDSSEKIVGAGTTTIASQSNLFATRYNSDGTIDTSFGTSGYATLVNAVANAVVTDSGDRVIAVGEDASTAQILIACYTSSGVLDSTFGSGGIVEISIGDGGSANAVIIDANGKFVLAGNAVISGQVYAFIARLNTDGSLDTSFGTSGITTITGVGNYTANTLAIDSNAKLVIGGDASGISGTDFLIIRFNSDGSIDTSFGSSGIVIVPVSPTQNDTVQSIAIGASNSIVAAGNTIDSSNNSSFAIIRCNNDGSLDTSFGSSGIVITSIGTNSQIFSCLIDQNSMIVASGSSDSQAATARYSSNGTLDSTFGISGILVTSIGSSAVIHSTTLQSSDGRVVAAGSTALGYLLMRYNKNNTDFVSIASITDNSTINTKIPAINGTSSAPSASVEILINGVPFTTVSTDGSGNWNAGTSTVLPIGENTIQANLIVSAVTIVSHVTKFTVADSFGEDSVFAFNSTSQTTSSSTFSALPFDNLINLETWSYNSSTFTCNTSGRYIIAYNGTAGFTAFGGLLTYANVAVAVFIDGTEYVGSEANVNIPLFANSAIPIGNAFIKDLTAGQTLNLEFGVTTTGVTTGSTLGLVANSSSSGTQHAYSILISRID